MINSYPCWLIDGSSVPWDLFSNHSLVVCYGNDLLWEKDNAPRYSPFTISFFDSLAFPSSLIVYEHWRGFIQMFILWSNIHGTYSHNFWEVDNLCIKHSSAHERKFTDESKKKHLFMSINITIEVTTWRCLLKTIIVIGCSWTFLITSPELFWWYRVPGRNSLLWRRPWIQLENGSFSS